jgi:DNA-binding response OmpR family regulator
MADANTGKKVLIVEDNETLGQMYETNFALKGLNVRRVRDGESALTAALNFKPDLILLDIMMPNINGFDVLDILRSTPATSAVPVIMMTALSEQEDRDHAKNLGATDYLVKAEVDLPTITAKVLSKLGVK